MQSIILAVHVVIALSLIGLILVQQGKGADAGAAFGSGSSGTVFGSQGSGNFLTKTTAALATLFFLTSLSLSYLSGKISSDKASEVEVMNRVEQIEIQDKPVLPVASPIKESSDKPAVPVE